MKVTLYLASPITRRPTGETLEVEVPDSTPKIASELWKSAGLEQPTLGCPWKPASDSDLFNGHGWVTKELLDPNTVGTLLKRGELSPEEAIAALDFDSLLELFEGEVREALVPPTSKVYPVPEQQTWPQQKSEAQAYINDTSATTPMLDAIAAAEGRTREDVALSILNKSEAYEQEQIAFVAKSNKIRIKQKAAQSAGDQSAILMGYVELINSLN